MVEGMNEYETDPRRPSADADAEPPIPMDESTRGERGPADSEPASAPSPSPVTPLPSAQPVSPASPAGPAQPVSPLLPAAAESGTPATVPPQPGPTVPATPAPPPSSAGHYPPSPWHSAYRPDVHQNQPGWTGNPAYLSQPGVVPPLPANHGPGHPPVWAQVPAASAPASRPGRLGRMAAGAAAALVLMVGSGIAGGAIALAVNDGPTDGGRTYTAAPIINGADLPKIAAAVENSVVSITTGNGEGSGVVLSEDGYVLTNNHVVASGSGDRVKVIFADGKNANAKVVGTDPKTDLAVLKVDGVSGLAAATLGDSDAMQVGDTVLALGSPLGLQGSVTAGIISARDRTIRAGGDDQQGAPGQQRTGVTSISGLLQTDAPINPGNSGGALVNTRGEVIGINTAIATSGQSNGNIGVGFAIPSNKAKSVADTLRAGGKVSHPSLGVGVGTAEEGGALISSVTPGSPAAKAGLQVGDIVTRFGGKVINDSNDLVAAVQAGKVGDRVDLIFLRNDAEKSATVTLAETS